MFQATTQLSFMALPLIHIRLCTILPPGIMRQGWPFLLELE